MLDIKSLIFNQKAKIKYIAKLIPKEKKLIYIKNNLTFLALIPIHSASLEHTENPWRSKKYLNSTILFAINYFTLPFNNSTF